MENGKKKARYRWIYIPAPRSAAQYPAGVSAASCPNYPFCNLAPVSFITRKQQKQKKNKKTTTASTIPSATSPLWVDSFYIKQFLMVTLFFMATNQMNLKWTHEWSLLALTLKYEFCQSRWFLLATSTLPATPPESVLLSAQDIPTAKQQGPQNVRASGKIYLFYSSPSRLHTLCQQSARKTSQWELVN